MDTLFIQIGIADAIAVVVDITPEIEDGVAGLCPDQLTTQSVEALKGKVNRAIPEQITQCDAQGSNVIGV